MNKYDTSGVIAETVSVAVTAEENSSILQATSAQLDAANQVATWTNLSIAQNSKSSQTFSLQPVISATDPRPPEISAEVTKGDGSTLKQEYTFTLAKPATVVFNTINMAEAIIWQLNTVRNAMQASHDVITVNAGKLTVN